MFLTRRLGVCVCVCVFSTRLGRPNKAECDTTCAPPHCMSKKKKNHKFPTKQRACCIFVKTWPPSPGSAVQRGRWEGNGGRCAGLAAGSRLVSTAGAAHFNCSWQTIPTHPLTPAALLLTWLHTYLPFILPHNITTFLKNIPALLHRSLIIA